jgi:hypothetical protein
MDIKERFQKTFGPNVRFDTGYVQTGGASEKRRGWWAPSARLGVGAVISGKSGNWDFLGYSTGDVLTRHDVYTPEPKRFVVIHGPYGNEDTVTIELSGVDEDEPLTPKLAVSAAMAACGHRNRVTVWSDDEYGYRLYVKSARKLYLDS